MDMTIEMDGFKELERQLGELEIVAQKRVLRQTARASSKPIEADLKQNIQKQNHVDTGNLLESVKTRVTFPQNTNYANVFASTGVFKNRKTMAASGKMDAPVYAYWLEYGTEAHALGKSAKRKRGKYQNKGLMHPGIPAKPFIRPAFDSNTEQAISIQKKELSKAIDRALARGR